MSIIFKVVFMFVFSFLTQLSYATDAEKLKDYVEKNCRSNCIDPALLFMVIEEASRETAVSQSMLLAIIKTESSFQANSINKNRGKSVGLFQIQVKWHREKFRSRNYSDVFENARAGALIYKECENRWRGSKEKALWCYNGHQKLGMKKYVHKVLLSYKETLRLGLDKT